MSAPPRSELRRAALWAAAVLAVVASAIVVELKPLAFLDPESRAAVRDFVRGLFPPDVSPAFLKVVAAAAGRTAAIAVVGTALSLVVALPLAILGTATLFRRGPLLESEPRSATGLLLSAASSMARVVLGILRAVPDLLWALFFVVAVGLGPVAGVLALAVSYGGVLGRVFADLFEDVDPRPLEALRATGASRAQIFLYGIVPQAMPSAVAYTLYSLECCVRAAAVLGLIGAGGIGYEIALSMRMFEYGQIVTLVVALLVLVVLTDACSSALRRVLRANAPRGVLGHVRQRGGESGGAVRTVALVVTGGVLVACAAATGFFDAGVLDSAMAGRLARFTASLFPPDLELSYLRTLVRPIAQTIGISVIGTLIGVAIGGVLGIFATSAMSEDDPSFGVGRRLRSLSRQLSRLVLALMRAIPDVMWVLVFILAVGLGPFAGTLALGVHTGGVLGKLYADTFEEVAPLPLRGLRSTGATPLQILLWGVWPEARTMLISYTVLRWEMNLRASTVVGLAGGGGIGIELYNSMQLGFYPRVATLIAAVYLMVATTGWIGDRLRRRIESASLRAA